MKLSSFQHRFTKIHFPYMNIKPMSAKFILSVYLFSLLTFTSSLAQTNTDFQNLLNLGDRTGQNKGALIYTRAGSYYGVLGTPYVNEKWVMGTVTAQNGKKHENIPVMYNAHYDLIEAVVRRDTLILDSRLVSALELTITDKEGSRFAVFKNGFTSKAEKIEPTHFFEVIYEGSQIKMLRKHYKMLKPSNFDAAYNTGSKFDEFIPVITTYIQTPSGIEKLKMNKKGVLSLMGSKAKQVEDFINKEKLKYNLDADLAKIFAFYESL